MDRVYIARNETAECQFAIGTDEICFFEKVLNQSGQALYRSRRCAGHIRISATSEREEREGEKWKRGFSDHQSSSHQGMFKMTPLCRIYSMVSAAASWSFALMNGRARVAWNIKRLRTERAISQENLAVDADVDRTYISGIERETFNPSIDLLERLALALSVDLAEFFTIPAKGAILPEPLKRGRRSASR